jgi:hypothetical protein
MVGSQWRASDVAAGRFAQASEPAASGQTIERAIAAGAGQIIDGEPVEFERMVPPSGNL